MKLWIILGSIALVHCKPRGSNIATDRLNGSSPKSPNPPCMEERIIHHIEDEMLALNKSDDPARDKRALGIILRGILEALGYTVSPIQIASLANPTPAAQMTAPVAVAPASPASRAAMMMMMPSMAMPTSKPNPINSSAAPPRQRETLRFTGILNFGNNLNTTNLISHLAQYEQLFHRNVTTTAAPPAAPPPTSPKPPSPTTPGIDHRRSRVQEPLFVKIPLPIAPNLSPPQQIADEQFTDTSYEHEEYSHGHSEEHREGQAGAGKKGNFEEEGDKSRHSEEYEHNYEYYPDSDEPRVTHDPKSKIVKSEVRILKTGRPGQKHVEQKEYKKNQNVVNYSVENKQIHDPSEVSVEGPVRVGSKFSHSMYVDEPNWKKEHENKMYKLAAEQEAKAEALAEENAEREKSRGNDHELNEDDAEFHRSREKEIDNRYENHANEYSKGNSGEEGAYEGEERTSREESVEDTVEAHDDGSVENDHEEETKITLKTSKTPESLGTKLPKANKNESSDSSKENLKSNSSESPPRESPSKSQQDNRERDGAGKRLRVIKRIKAKTPVAAYAPEESGQNLKLRDSYGKVLEKPGGHMDERIAGYIGMFKNPDTGIYEPHRIQELESLQKLYDHPNLINDIKKVQNQYDLPRNKYEEYELPADGMTKNAEGANIEMQSLTEGPYEIRRDDPRKVSQDQGLTDGRKNPAVILPYAVAGSSDDYGPYYSSYSHLYGPPNSDQGIIERLTSYNPSLSVGFADRIDSGQQFIGSNSKKEPPSATPTSVTLPEKLMPADLSLDGESKGVTAWPAPFDYVFDNSENKNIVLKGDSGSSSSPSATHQDLNYPISSGLRPSLLHGVQPSQPNDDRDRVQIFFKNIQRAQPIFRVDEVSQVQQYSPGYPGTRFQRTDKILDDKINFLPESQPVRLLTPHQRDRPLGSSMTSHHPEGHPSSIQRLNSESQVSPRSFDYNTLTALGKYGSNHGWTSYAQQTIPIPNEDSGKSIANYVNSGGTNHNHAAVVRKDTDQRPLYHDQRNVRSSSNLMPYQNITKSEKSMVSNRMTDARKLHPKQPTSTDKTTVMGHIHESY